MHTLSLGTFIAFFLFSPSVAWSHDVCETKYTRMHYAQSRCYDVETRLMPESSETFKIHSVLISKDLNLVADRPTVVLVPGGPGESAEPLKTELQKKDFLNGMWGPMGVNVVLFDPRGTGMSALPQETTSYDGAVLSTANQVEDLKNVIDAIEPDRPVFLFAHSAGGHVSLAFAEKYPDRVAGLLLLSVSSSAREMARLNIATYALDSEFWTEIEKLLPSDERSALKQKYARIEDVLVQQLKARILGKYAHPNLKSISPMDFRSSLLRRIQQDPTGQSTIELIDSYALAFEEMDQKGPLLIPAELRALKLNESDLRQFNYSAKEWIQLNIMCGEGFLSGENEIPTIYDGVQMKRFCKGLHAASPSSEPVLENIRTPITILAGDEDTAVPNYATVRMAQRLPNAKLILTPGAGHVFVDKKPMVLYKALEDLVRTNAQSLAQIH